VRFYMSNNEMKNVKVKDFFKRSILINELEEALEFKPDTLIGIDQISSNKLEEHEIKSIEDMAKAS